MLTPRRERSGPDTEEDGDDDPDGDDLAGEEWHVYARALDVIVGVKGEDPTKVEEGRDRRARARPR